MYASVLQSHRSMSTPSRQHTGQPPERYVVRPKHVNHTTRRRRRRRTDSFGRRWRRKRTCIIGAAWQLRVVSSATRIVLILSVVVIVDDDYAPSSVATCGYWNPKRREFCRQNINTFFPREGRMVVRVDETLSRLTGSIRNKSITLMTPEMYY